MVQEGGGVRWRGDEIEREGGGGGEEKGWPLPACLCLPSHFSFGKHEEEPSQPSEPSPCLPKLSPIPLMPPTTRVMSRGPLPGMHHAQDPCPAH